MALGQSDPALYYSRGSKDVTFSEGHLVLFFILLMGFPAMSRPGHATRRLTALLMVVPLFGAVALSWASTFRVWFGFPEGAWATPAFAVERAWSAVLLVVVPLGLHLWWLSRLKLTDEGESANG